jgi:hypothetical protein
MQRSFWMPFFWAKRITPALLLGVVTSGCAAAGGAGEERPAADEPPSLSSTPSVTPMPVNSAPIPPIAPSGSERAADTASTPSANVSGADPAANEGSPIARRDDEAAPPADMSGAEPGATPNAANPEDDDDDRDEDDDDQDDRDDDDDDDRDDGDDDDDDDDDRDDDDDDDTGVTPEPNIPAPSPGDPAPDVITFSADIRPILVAQCGRCHASGGLPQFASANAATGFDVAFRERNSIVSEIRNGNMPADTCDGAPGSDGCVSVADFERIQQWVMAGAPE